jgi:glutamine synthetase
MADRTVLYKHGAKEIAHLQGCSLTSWPSTTWAAAGSSFHLHSSLWDP